MLPVEGSGELCQPYVHGSCRWDCSRRGYMAPLGRGGAHQGHCGLCQRCHHHHRPHTCSEHGPATQNTALDQQHKTLSGSKNAVAISRTATATQLPGRSKHLRAGKMMINQGEKGSWRCFATAEPACASGPHFLAKNRILHGLHLLAPAITLNCQMKGGIHVFFTPPYTTAFCCEYSF